jgi:hypothetical protein
MALGEDNIELFKYAGITVKEGLLTLGIKFFILKLSENWQEALVIPLLQK